MTLLFYRFEPNHDDSENNSSSENSTRLDLDAEAGYRHPACLLDLDPIQWEDAVIDTSSVDFASNNVY